MMRRVIWLAASYVAVLAVCSLALMRTVAVDRKPAQPAAKVVSLWMNGQRVARAVTEGDAAKLLREREGERGVSRVVEEVLDEAPILAKNAVVFGGSFVPAHDGVKLEFRGKTVYATPDDLQKVRAYIADKYIGPLRLTLGLDRDKVMELFARELRVSSAEILEDGRFRRLAVRRQQTAPQRDDLSVPTLRAAVLAAGRTLARAVRRDGTYRYEIDPLTNASVPGYSWPRHGGATWFLVQVARYDNNQRWLAAGERAARRMIDGASLQCGAYRCIGEGDETDAGSSALALLAYVELIEAGSKMDLAPEVRSLADFLTSLQRPDGEFKHVFDVKAGQAKDVQLPFYTGEVALALSRAHRVTKDPKHLRAASRALDYLVQRPALFVTAPLFWKAEHWTCQAIDDLWDRAPNPRALEFCLDWQRYIRAGTREPGGEIDDYTGAFTRNPFIAPRITGSASRMEAGVATLAVARRANVPASEVAALDSGVRQTLQFLLRSQFLPGPTHLMPAPRDVYGSYPGSAIDLNVRIDFPQHAGAALLRYLKLMERK